MAVNTLAFATILMQALDQKAVQTMCTGWMDANAGQVKYTGGNEVKIPTISTDGLGDYGRRGADGATVGTGFPAGAAKLEYKTYTMSQDRGRKFGLDRHDVDETNFVATAAQIMNVFQTENVVPEIDAYRISKLASYVQEGMKKEDYTPAADSMITELKTGIKNIRKRGYNGSLICMISYDALMEVELAMAGKLTSTTFAAGGFNTTCPSIDGVPLVPVPDNRMYTAITLYDGTTGGQTAGGYVKGGSALDINFLICPTTTPIAVTKQDNMRIFSPDVNQAADEWSMDYRRYHELWVLDSRKDSIYLCTKASS